MDYENSVGIGNKNISQLHPSFTAVILSFVCLKQMPSTTTLFKIFSSFSCFIAIAFITSAQDLDPRAYVKAPVKGTFLIGGYSHSEGEVLTDPTLPLENLNATVNVASVGVARTFSLFGRSAQALAVLPYG